MQPSHRLQLSLFVFNIPVSWVHGMLAGILFIVSMHLYIQKISIKNEIKKVLRKVIN